MAQFCNAVDGLRVEVGADGRRVVVDDKRAIDLAIQPGEEFDALLLPKPEVVRRLDENRVRPGFHRFVREADGLRRVGVAAPRDEEGASGIAAAVAATASRRSAADRELASPIVPLTTNTVAPRLASVAAFDRMPW